METRGQERDAGNGRDTELMRLIQQGDQAALSAFYDRRSGLIYSLVLGVLRNTQDSEEVTLEVFYKVWQKADTFDPGRGSALAWVVTIARRLAIDRTRSKQFKARDREVTLDAPINDRAVAGQAVPAAEQMDIRVQANDIVRALDRLEPTHRELIRLAYFEGLSHAMISKRLETPLGTVKSRLREAMVQLRRQLDIKV